MTITQFRPENSTRGDILYSKLRPHIWDDMAIIDIGCAYSCMVGLIRKDFPNCKLFGFDGNGGIIGEMQKTHPYYRWKRVLVKDGTELEGHELFPLDVIIHIGLDGEWSNIWKVHPWLIENHLPKVVFLETGRRDYYEGPMATYKKVVALYIDAGYKLVDWGQFDFDWDGKCLKDRRWSILTKGGV